MNLQQEETKANEHILFNTNLELTNNLLKLLNISPANDIKTEDITKLSNLSITPEVKWLYVDALNFSGKFFHRGESHWKILQAVQRIKSFIKAAENSGWKLKVFIDAAYKSDEAANKFKKRREAEVIKEKRDVPQAMNTLLGDAFKENGIEVLYSLEADNDDTLAAYAHRDGAAILSGDQDFYRYEGLTCPIYGAFLIVKKKLILTPQIKNDKFVPPREIISPPPNVLYKDSGLSGLSRNMYLRGTPTALTKKLGNPHHAVRPLRRALYHRRQVTGTILEIYPTWSDNKVVWISEHVSPDPELDHLLDKPKEALEIFFGISSLSKPDEVLDGNWQNHLYALHAVVYEICALASKTEVSLLEILRPALADFLSENRPLRTKPAKRKVQQKEAPAYEAQCKYCNGPIVLYQRDVEFYQEKGFSMPKQCKECKMAYKRR